MGVLSLAKLAGTDQRYYLDQAGGRVDHAGSVSSGVEDYYLGGPEAAGRWTGSSARLLGLTGRVGEAPLRAALSQHDPRSGEKLAGPAARAKVPGGCAAGCRAVRVSGQAGAGALERQGALRLISGA